MSIHVAVDLRRSSLDWQFENHSTSSFGHCRVAFFKLQIIDGEPCLVFCCVGLMRDVGVAPTRSPRTEDPTDGLDPWICLGKCHLFLGLDDYSFGS